jgi:type I restriction enzyme S subunit
MAGVYLGQAAVFDEDFECSSNQAIAKIVLRRRSVNPYFLSTYLNCEFGQAQIGRLRTVTGQPNINLGLIKRIKVPCLGDTFQELIASIVTTGVALYRQSEELYTQSEQHLLSELGLQN